MSMEPMPEIGKEHTDEPKHDRSMAEIMNAFSSNPNIRRQLQEKLMKGKKQKEKQQPEGKAPTQH